MVAEDHVSSHMEEKGHVSSRIEEGGHALSHIEGKSHVCSQKKREQRTQNQTLNILVNNKPSINLFSRHRGFLSVHCVIMISVIMEG